ncbi:porphobilinogen synthase [Desulfonatronospira sp. MSAO_Bac3]|uniref:porphobilinogen synthase n=1 Tax=Desulfonatronospira sp. MSAO_Bac3 TaxID=2293857 RepID=UPI000FF8339F|nr:porphobilinogen synthase [Desulfonatronospira sp. MSAO_Bac3]RQD77964.1 MAG: porphobilinogen synthase [Desulfonatronospira sp. MSAO_Bac3]
MNSSNFYRGRRLRSSKAIREMVRETDLLPRNLVQPFFVLESRDPKESRPIASMPGQSQLAPAALEEEVSRAVDLGLQSVILFGIPVHKDARASQAYAQDGIIQQTVQKLKKRFPSLVIITDVCLCEYTDHGHCGLIQDKKVQNDPSLGLLARTALSHAQAGADIVAPSDMMDGRVQAIRDMLDNQGFKELPIMSYAVKYASAYYGPFREAAQSAPSFGDRKTYQMDPGNAREALREAEADIIQGADMLMVKPALPYLDIISALQSSFNLPVAAYQVSGEYSQIKAAAQLGWLDEKSVALESVTAVKRAGAEIILTYFTREILGWMAGNE